MWSVSRSVTVPSQSRTSRINASGHAQRADAVDLELARRRRRRRATTTGGPAITSPGRSIVRRPASASASAQENAVRRALDGPRRPRSAGRRARPWPISSGVTTDGPSTSPKSDCFTSGCSAGSCHSSSRRSAADLAVGADHDGDPRPRREARARDRRRSARPRRSRWRSGTSRPSSKSRTVGGYCTGTSRVTSASGYSACSRAPPPPRKNDCSVCAARWSIRSSVDAADPPAVERVVVRVEHAEAHRRLFNLERRLRRGDWLRARCGRSPRRRRARRPRSAPRPARPSRAPRRGSRRDRARA